MKRDASYLLYIILGAIMISIINIFTGFLAISRSIPEPYASNLIKQQLKMIKNTFLILTDVKRLYAEIGSVLCALEIDPFFVSAKKEPKFLTTE